MNLGLAIKTCRTRREITQIDLARRAGCSLSYMSLIENNKRDPTLSTLMGITMALAVPPVILFYLASDASEMAAFDPHIATQLARVTMEILAPPVPEQGAA